MADLTFNTTAGAVVPRKMLILYLAILLVTGTITAQMTNIMF